LPPSDDPCTTSFYNTPPKTGIISGCFWDNFDSSPNVSHYKEETVDDNLDSVTINFEEEMEQGKEWVNISDENGRNASYKVCSDERVYSSYSKRLVRDHIKS
jgi:hypothetical protein